jgi:outer membrane protein OmpA-like peptidoglycan-associated protein
MKKIMLLLIGSLLVVTPGYGGWLDETLQQVGEGLGNRAAHEAADSAYDGAKDGARETVKTKDAHKQNQPASGDGQGQDSTVGNRKGTRQQSSSDGDRENSSGSVADNEQVFSKYDFVPGDKVIFYDDFSDTDVGEFPRKWHLKGPKDTYNNAIEVVEFQGRRMMRSQPASGEANQPTSTQYIRINSKGDLPQKFTIEFDAYFANMLNDDYNTFYHLYMLNDEEFWPGGGDLPIDGTFQFSGLGGNSKNTRTTINKNDKKLHHIAVSVNGSFVKAYVDNQRVINDPDGLVRPIKLIGISMGAAGMMASDKVMIGNIRLAEGGKDVRSALVSDGKIITHGILFDTGKDVVKPESLPTLKMILGLLEDDGELRFSIEGHTDSQGNKGANQTLSEKRAAAVKNWLAGKGIASARLKTKGFGDSKPIDGNKTPEARANNRRVEFVRF